MTNYCLLVPYYAAVISVVSQLSSRRAHFRTQKGLRLRSRGQLIPVEFSRFTTKQGCTAVIANSKEYENIVRGSIIFVLAKFFAKIFVNLHRTKIIE